MTTSSVMIGAGPNLRVILERCKDRWGHRIELLRDGSMISGLESIEGAASDAWPPSPAFQTLDLQSFAGGGQTALLVGKAGMSHWSAAVEADPNAGTLRFDIACRVAQLPSFLGSSYATMHESREAVEQVFPTVALVNNTDDCPAALETSPAHLIIRVSSLASDLPKTFRWVYSVAHPRAAN